MDIGAVVLHKIITDKSLDGWSRIKLSFFNVAYSSVYSAISKYYNKYNSVPDFSELDLFVRDPVTKQNLKALASLEIPDVELDIAIDSLVNEYTQNEALKSMDRFIDEITIMDSEQIKSSISEIALTLDEKTHTSTTVVNSDQITIFQPEDTVAHKRVALGISNLFDSEQGARRTEYMIFGGERGKGKSVVCSNVAANQYIAGDVGVYFTIEMRAHEIFERHISILSGVPVMHIRHNKLTEEQVRKIAKVRADMFADGEVAYREFLEHKDRYRFESQLVKNCSLKKDNQLVIIDDPALSITSIDVHLQKLKAKFGDKLKVAVIDYINQITTTTSKTDKFDWKAQIDVSSHLKAFGPKYDILVVSAFQIDSSGEARFAKGILDSADYSFKLGRGDGFMDFENTKIRSGPAAHFRVGMNWDTLTIDPTEMPREEKKKKEGHVPTVGDNKESAGDLPF
jgi:replicative DNA helicase